jgi:Tubulin-tyrosine ligase family
MDEKLHKSAYGGFSIISVAPSRPSQIESSVISKIKNLQLIESANCQGVSVESTGKAGRSLHSKPYTSSYLAKYYEKSKEALQKLLQEPDTRPSLIKFTAIKDPKHQPNENLTYRMFQSEVKLVRTILENSGFVLNDGHDWNLLWIGHNPKPNFYEKISIYQKISHFPNSFEITRKDRLCSAMARMQELFGKENFNFIPETYNLPEDFSLLYSNFHNQRPSKSVNNSISTQIRLESTDNNKEKKVLWIVKPTCSSQGKGIYIIDNPNEIPLDEVCIVSKYIANPLLINNLKFDLRIYVLVSSYEPLRIYIYEEGLARFASEIYKPGQKNNRFMHLTNYSLNKKSENFIQNEDFRVDNTGHKWSMSAVMKLLESHGINTDLLWKGIYDIIIKTILSGEETVIETVRKLGLSRNNCFDLLGFDVLIDNDLKPWLLEVNLSPSMATDSPLDIYIKSNLLVDMFNLIGVRAFDKKKDMNYRTKSFSKTNHKRAGPSRSQSPPAIKKEGCSNRFKDVLRECLEEQDRRGHFIRIYPSKGSNYFDQFFVCSRAINQCLYKSLYIEIMQESEIAYNILKIRPVTCATETEVANLPVLPSRVHQKRPVSIENPPKNIFPEISQSEELKFRCKLCKESISSCTYCKLLKVSRDEKIIITGDDILMEYLSRLIQVLKNSKETLLKSTWKQKINNFLTHPAWINMDNEQKLWKRILNRLQEMKERRKKLISVLKRKKILLDDTEKESVINNILRKFNSSELEEMLKVSTRNTALEIVKCLIENEGILTEMLTQGVRTDITRELDSPSFEETEYEKSVFTTQFNKETLRDKFFSKHPARKKLTGKEIDS